MEVNYPPDRFPENKKKTLGRGKLSFNNLKGDIKTEEREFTNWGNTRKSRRRSLSCK